MTRIKFHKTTSVGAAVVGLLALAPLVSAAPQQQTGPPAKGKTILPPPPPTVQPKAAAVRNGSLAIKLDCLTKGSVRVRYRGNRLGRASFACFDGRATARVPVARRISRQLLRDRGVRLRVTARSFGTAASTRTLRLGGATARAAVWRDYGVQGQDLFSVGGSCEGYNMWWNFASMLNSPYANDRLYLAFRAYLPSINQYTPWKGWYGPKPVRQKPSAFPEPIQGVFKLVKGQWIAVQMQIWSERANGYLGGGTDWLKSKGDGDLGETSVSGFYCRAV